MHRPRTASRKTPLPSSARPPLTLPVALGHVGAFWLVAMVVLVGAGALARILPNWSAAVVIGASAALGTLLASLGFLRWERWPAASAGLVPDRRTPLRFLLGLGAGFGLVAVHTLLMVAFGGVRWAWAPVPPSLPAILLAVVGFLLLACREELAFRGYPLRLLVATGGPWLAQCVMAALFIVEHRLGGSSWASAVVGAGLGALVFGAAALVGRGLALPLGLHVAWNVGDWARGGKGGWWPVDPGSRGGPRRSRAATGSGGVRRSHGRGLAGARMAAPH